jgi:N-acetylmuramoyl-L-alanine amidase
MADILHCGEGVSRGTIIVSKGGIYLTKNRKKKNRYGLLKATVSMLMAALILISASTVPIAAKGEAAGESRVVGTISEGGGKVSYTLAGVPNRNVSAHKKLNIKVNGSTLSQPALVMNGATYLPLEAFLLSLGKGSISYNKTTRTMVVAYSGLNLSVADGAFVTYANGRPLFSFTPAVVMNNGIMYIPQLALIKAVGLKEGTKTSSEIRFSGSFNPLVSASKYYREDEVYWLSKIISAESRGEPILGQIAVGNVIMNRRKSTAFPNTIWGVIFDKRYGIQFSPVADGTIYQDPTYNATLAAKICLEGTSLSDETLYFLAPKYATSSWIVKNREYAYTILNHDFYK